MPIARPCESIQRLPPKIFKDSSWGFSKSTTLENESKKKSEKDANKWVEKINADEEKRGCRGDCKHLVLKKIRSYVSCKRVWFTLGIAVRCTSQTIAEIAIICYKEENCEPTWETMESGRFGPVDPDSELN